MKRGKPKRPRVFHADLWGGREEWRGDRLVGGKYFWLLGHDVRNTNWTRVDARAPHYLFTPIAKDTQYQNYISLDSVFRVKSLGITTGRDNFCIQYSPNEMKKVLQEFSRMSAEEARLRFRLGEDRGDWGVQLALDDIKRHKNVESLIVPILYRPFDLRYTFYSGTSRGFHCRSRNDVMQHMLPGNNLALSSVRAVEIDQWEHALCTNRIIQLHSVSLKEVNYLYPLYLYENSNGDELFNGRTHNFTPGFVERIQERLGMKLGRAGKQDSGKILEPRDVFNYIYAVLHAPTYRQRYAEFLKTDFPRVPLTSDSKLFRRLGKLGDELVGLHLMERVPPSKVRFPVEGSNEVDKPLYVPPKSGRGGHRGRVYINNGQYFENVPQNVWDFRVGGYQVCEKWLKDRKERALAYDDIEHYRNVVTVLGETTRVMEEIDKAIPKWPIE